MIGISVFFNTETGEVEVSLTEGKNEYKQRNKGKSLLVFPEEFIVIDTETTGLDPCYCELIEFAGIKIKNGKEVARFHSLIKPEEEIDEFITDLTGITNDMLKNAPLPKEVVPSISEFLGDSILVAHNAHFDINFLYDYFEQYLNMALANNFVCTMRLTRKVFPEFKNHKLKTICKELDISLPTHRSLPDAIAAWETYKHCYEKVDETIGIDNFEKWARKKKSVFKARDIAATVDDFTPDHPLFAKHCVFTGTLSKMNRRNAMQLVVNLGGSCGDNVTKNTDYLILGVQDYSRFANGEKSLKLKKAEDLIRKGQELEIISENTFYDLVLQG